MDKMSDASPTILTVHHFSYSTPTEDAWLTHADNKQDVFHIKNIADGLNPSSSAVETPCSPLKDDFLLALQFSRYATD